MKKNIIQLLLLTFILILLFINNNTLGNCIISTSYLFINNFFPYFISIYIISKLLINYNLPYYIAKLFNNNIYIYIFTLGIISGTPNNIIIIKDLLNKKIININEANKYIKCSFFTNPLFLYTMLNKIFNIKFTINILISHYLANIIIYLLNPIKNNNIQKIKTIDISSCLINSIKEVSILSINIYITIIIFNILLYILPIPNYFKGLIEITYGLNYLIITNLKYKDLLSLIYISFGGFSILTQIKEILEDTNINFYDFLISRFYQIIISILISKLMLMPYYLIP